MKRTSPPCFFCGKPATRDLSVIGMVEFLDGRRVPACPPCWKIRPIGWDKPKVQGKLFDGRDIREAMG